MKVYGGTGMGDGGVQVRIVVLARSMVNAVRALNAVGHNVSLYEMRGYWYETGNAEELEAAKRAGENVPIARPLDSRDVPFVPLKRGGK